MIARIIKYVITLVLTSVSIIGIGKLNAFGASMTGIAGFVMSLLLNQVHLVVKFVTWLYPGCWGSKDRKECNEWIEDKKAYMTMLQMVVTYWVVCRLPFVGKYVSGFVGSIKSFGILMAITTGIIMVVSGASGIRIEGNKKANLSVYIATAMKIILGLTGVQQIEWLFGDY